MLTRVFAVGLLAGLLAGLIVALLQAYTTTPLILEAERFENAPAAAHAAAASAFAPARLILVHDAHEHAHADSASEWQPSEGLERTLFTAIATIGTAVGFALILIAGMLWSGDRINERSAMAWGAAGFAAAGLAPAMGIAPEIPGMMAADLFARQQWWLTTCAATAAALWLFLRAEQPWLRLIAVILLIAPHAIGAPHLGAEASGDLVPAELAARFAATSLAVQATLWIATGYFVGLLWTRIGAGEDSADGL